MTSLSFRFSYLSAARASPDAPGGALGRADRFFDLEGDHHDGITATDGKRYSPARDGGSYAAEAVRGLAKFYRKSPDAISVEEVQSYLLHLLRERRLSYSTCNLVTNGLRFFYRITLGQSETEFCLPHSKVPQRLPEILSREEIARLFEVTTNRTGRSPAFMRYRMKCAITVAQKWRVTTPAATTIALRGTG